MQAAGTPAWFRPAWPGATAGLLLGLLAVGPGLGPGYLLSYDMVAVPRQPFTAAMFGWGGALPRAVPSDAVTAAAARVLPADVVQKLFLLAIFVLAGAGLALEPGDALILDCDTFQITDRVQLGRQPLEAVLLKDRLVE